MVERRSIGQRGLGRYLALALLCLFAIVWVTPLAIVVLSSMKTPIEQSQSAILALPENAAMIFDNIASASELSGIGNGILSSLIYAFVGSLAAVIAASSAAYSIAMLKIRFPFFWFLIIYSGTIFPFQMYLMPLFGLYQSVGLYDTRFGMLLFYSAIAVPFCIFVFRNYFIGMQGEVIEAASLDGASSFQTYLRIVLPMAKAPALFLFVTQFSWIWNDFLFGQVLAKSDDVRPVMTSLAMLSGTYGKGSIPQQMAGALTASIPTLILFFALQRHFMQGIVLNTAGE
ncbi:MAG: carbohydrate ABC transporter permease [Chloroflexota bacterium]|nr:carbohydrate ABC transporter permease [Chloroflexota bacterium]MDE2908019.1 carbohydrate ABC transporter permease [Chloroflexota bacterium]